MKERTETGEVILATDTMLLAGKVLPFVDETRRYCKGEQYDIYHR